MNANIIFLDLTTAYDTLNLKVLLSKSNSYGIRGVANLWFESCLSNWKQCVEINSMKQGTYVSNTREIAHGVPQGLILGPILFLLYVNDLPSNIMGSKLVVFADDTNILVSGENLNTLQYKLNSVMEELQTWFTVNSLVVNVEKMLAISFHMMQNKKPVLPCVIYESTDIPYNTDKKFLGIHSNENMKWNNHIKYLSSKSNTSYYMINSLKNAVSRYVLKTMYFAYFHVHLR
jgi:hypothetical protein